LDRLRTILLAGLLFFSLHLAAAERVNVNTADAETLMSIQGIGEKRAEAILDYRKENGPFSSVEELMNVEGVGQATLDNNRDILTAE